MLAARHIGFFAFFFTSDYLSVFVALVSGAHQVSEDERLKIVLGFDSRLFSNENQTEILSNDLLNDERDDDNLPVWIPMFYLFYSLFAAVSSALLIWASVTKERWLTIPWMICSVTNAGSQIASLTMLSLSHFTEKHKWITTATIIHSILILYFFTIVVAAQFFGKAEKKTMSKSTINMKLGSHESLVGMIY